LPRPRFGRSFGGKSHVGDFARKESSDVHHAVGRTTGQVLTDAHSIEQQAVAQLRTAPDRAGEPELERIFREHLVETEGHERLVRQRLEAHGAEPSKVKEAVMALGGKSFVLVARSQPDTPGKLTAHADSYEVLGSGAYELLRRVAERAGDEETVDVARGTEGRDLNPRRRDRRNGGAAGLDLALLVATRRLLPGRSIATSGSRMVAAPGPGGRVLQPSANPGTDSDKGRLRRHRH
jgi:ferritin-like metal-binding protein YciE